MFNTLIISKSNLINNIKQVKKNNPCSKICAMVKANAYGIGLKPVVNILEQYVDFFGVACFFEAQEVLNFTSKNILIVGPLEHGNINEKFSYTVNSVDDIKYLITLNKKIKIHIKINTGMNRFGFSCVKSLKQALKLISKSKLFLEGVFTHFATSDDYINTQMENFSRFAKIVKKGFPNVIVHADNSAVNQIKNHNLDMVRIGFNLYNKTDNNFKAVAKIKSKVVQINMVKKNELVGYDYRFVAKKKIKVAVIPIGYADGFDLNYIGLNLKIQNRDCKVLNVCMDCFMIDISKTKLKKGDEIFLLNEINTLNKFANYSKSTSYEVMTKFSFIRAERVVEN